MYLRRSAISDNSGNVVAEYTYDPWGKVLSVTGTNSALGNLNPVNFPDYDFHCSGVAYVCMGKRP